MVKINVNVKNSVKLLTQLKNSQDNIINIAETSCLIPSKVKYYIASVSMENAAGQYYC